MQDKKGRTYWLNIFQNDILVILSLYHCGVEIGKATAVWLADEREMNIGDLGTDEN